MEMLAAVMQKAICSRTSTLSTTATSSISEVSASHSEIRLLDCSIASGHISPVKRARTAAAANTAYGLLKLCLRMKLIAISIIRTVTAVSMTFGI